jgi:hypothetical protein
MSFRTVLPARRILAAALVAAACLVAAPAAGAVVSQGYGIAAAGTVNGSVGPMNGGTQTPVTVQFASIQNCAVPGGSSFVAHWTDAAGAHALTLVPGANANQCSTLGSSQIQYIFFDSQATMSAPSDSFVDGVFQGPGFGDTVSFTAFFIENGTGYQLFVGDQTPGPLQGAPGRIQPFGAPPADT